MASVDVNVAKPTPPLSQKLILITWLPLAASWLLMAVEGPYINGALARIDDSVRMIAAFGLAASLSIFIESPVISLLATSTALARSKQNYLMLRRYTLHLMAGTTLLQFLLAWTPLFDLVVIDIMGVPESLHEPVRLGLRLMQFWSAAIAWRRFKQGVLIRLGHSHFVGKGTVIRLLGSVGGATVLALFTSLPGIAVGALSLSAGVIAEALYAELVSAPLIRERFGDADSLKRPELSYRELLTFHWPLATSNLLFLFTPPIIAAALARGPQPELALAAWPVLNGLLFVTRAPEMALPEVAIALNDEKESQTAIRRFALTVGVISCAFLALIGLTPLSHFYFETLIGLTPALASMAEAGARLALLMPLAMAFVAGSRGLLTAQHITRPQAVAIAVELVTLIIVLVIGVSLGFPGVSVAAIAMTAALTTEAIYLGLVSRQNHIPVIPIRAGAGRLGIKTFRKE
ncbi:MAG: hypothetical protein WEC37_03825 [Anaerolineales bacterium]